jgi:PAP2 superfamily
MYVTRTAILVRSRLSWILGQAGMIALGLVAYFGIRGLTQGSPRVAVLHAHHIVDFERSIGIYVEPTVQSWIAPHEVPAMLANWMYVWGHWPVILATMIWLAWQHREVFLRLRDGMLISGALGMVVFLTYPVAPPRLAGLGLVDTVTDHSRTYYVLQSPLFVNQYAAVPSLHVGWNLLVGIAIVTAATSVSLRAVGFAMPVLMAVAVVATANHYLVDVVAGVAFALLGHAGALVLERRRLLDGSDPPGATE